MTDAIRCAIVDGESEKVCLLSAHRSIKWGADIVMFSILKNNGHKTEIYIIFATPRGLTKFGGKPLDVRELEMAVLRPLWDSRPTSKLSLDGILPARLIVPMIRNEMNMLLRMTIDDWQVKLSECWAMVIGFNGQVQAQKVAEVLGLEIALKV